jgi:zinc protease
MNVLNRNNCVSIISSDPNSSLKTSSICVLIRVGSSKEPDGQFGIAHLIEHLLFRSDSKLTKSRDWKSDIVIQGGEYNAITEYDYTILW